MGKMDSTTNVAIDTLLQRCNGENVKTEVNEKEETIGVDTNKNEKKKNSYCATGIYLTLDIKEKTREYAHKYRISQSEVVRRAMEEFFNKEGWN